MTDDTTKTQEELLAEIEALKKVAERGQAGMLFDLAPLPYQSLDESGNILNVNHAWLELFGYDKHEVIGRWIGGYLAPDSVALLKERFSAFLAEGEVRSAEFVIIKQDGSRALVTVDGRIRYDTSGNFSQTHCILTDITEKRRAEEELAASEQRFRRLFESSREGIIYTNTDGSIVNINPTLGSMLGYSQDDLLGKNIQDITPEKWHDSGDSIVRDQVLKTGESGELRKEFLHAQKIAVPVSVRMMLNRSAEGVPLGAWHIIKDLSQELLVEKSLKESEYKYQRIVETANEVIMGLDGENRIVFVNDVFSDFLGYDRKDVIGKHLYEFVRPEDREDQEKHFLLRKQGVRDRYERTFVRKDGSVVWGLVSATPQLDESGAYAGSFAMIMDITERKRAAQELRVSEKKYRDIFEYSVEGLYQSTVGGRFISVNPALAKIMGYDSPEDLLASMNDLSTQFYASPDDRRKVLEVLERDGEISSLEIRHRRKDGRLIWIMENARAIRDDAGEIEMLEGSVVDITERKLAEEKLKLTQFSVDNAPVSVCWINSDGQYVYANEHACQSLGYTQDELLQKSIMDVNPFFKTVNWPAYWEERRKTVLRKFEFLRVRKDGSSFPAEIVSHYKSYGGQEYLFTYVYDLTERKDANRALRHSQELFDEVQRISRIGGWDVSMDTGDIFWSAGQAQLHGKEPGYAPKDLREFMERYVHPDSRTAVASAWEKIVRNLVPVEIEYRGLKADGSEVLFFTTGLPDVDETGTLRRIYGSNRDVTEERLAEQGLKESHERMLKILDGIDADIYVSGIETDEVLFMNAHMREHFGELAAGSKCHKAFRDEPEPCSFCPKGKMVDAAGKPVDTIICERFNPLTRRWYLNHDRAIEWLEGKLVHMHMAADITDLKSMEEELKVAMVEAETANIAKNEFLANMSHEIRTPLNGLLGMLQLLQLTSLVDDQRDYLDTAVTSGQNLLQILNDILDLSKIESGMLEFDDQELELGEILESVVSVFRHQAESRGLEITWHIDESLPRHFLADKGRMRQILFNLVGNATKFTKQGSIRVEGYPIARPLKDGRTQLYFSVSDTGIGIPDDKIERIFDPFTQVDGSFSRKYQGTGLGLGIVRRLVTLMGGNIAVISEEEKGTTIVFTLAVQSASPSRLPRSVEMKGDIGGLDILVAEDEHVNRIVAKRLLGKLGHTVTCVESGEKAVEILRTETFDCVLMDIQMPGMDGMETTRVLRKELKIEMPIVALTAHAMKGDRKRFIESGMDGYMAKPFDMNELQDELFRVMTEARK